MPPDHDRVDVSLAAGTALIIYPRGSEWKKWDLHVHPPGTKLNDQYGSPADWDRFCAALESSDLAAFGIADYFSLDGYFECAKEFKARYPKSNKLLLPNLELRLNESVNKEIQTVDIHVLMRPDITEEKAKRFLHDLKTELQAKSGAHKLSCDELTARDDYERATVTRSALDEAIQEAFGTGRHRKDNVILVVAANDRGIHAVAGEKRKANLADEIDRVADAFFGSDANVEYFMRADRFEDGSPSPAKPVYGGCDAHRFDDLEAWLGKDVSGDETRKTVTWIKADPTFEGLQQTLVEPRERVRIQPTRPDHKEPYKFISRITFSNSDDFPTELVLNQNLVSIIGSRSSGKSALLAYIAHAVDPEYTLQQQMATGLIAKPADAGPAAAKTWAEVAEIKCSVEWGDTSATDGKVIYIPQNSLHAISGRPSDITEKIQPALYRLSDEYRVAHEQARRTTQVANDAIATAVTEYFRLLDEAKATKRHLQDLGDAKAIDATRLSLEAEIRALRVKSALSNDDVAAFEQLTAQFRAIDARVDGIDRETSQLSAYVRRLDPVGHEITTNVQVAIQLRPQPSELPADLGESVEKLAATAREDLLGKVTDALINGQAALDEERSTLAANRSKLEEDNADLIARNRASAQLDALIESHETQVAALGAIAREKETLASHLADQTVQVRAIEEHLADRAPASRLLEQAFASEPNDLDGMTFGFEEQMEEDVIAAISERFNKHDRSVFIDPESRTLDFKRAQRDPGAFLAAVSTGEQKLIRGVTAGDAAAAALCAAPSIRFYARLDGDRIGGFERSSMTPGKQALFALTLTLSESLEAWPLLIDQPEDDLDSRAIYDTIVPYLKGRKRERQIIMATHNANLVVGSDSEQVVVTNRHGNDRKNRDGQTFAYLTGSLEHSVDPHATEYILESRGVKEHACSLLDGGEEAFQKRRDKYKM